MNILFLCVGNSGRSQIAEGLAKDMLPKSCDIRSAGSKPAKNVHNDAIFVMNEIGIDISSNETKSIESLDEDFVSKLLTKGIDIMYESQNSSILMKSHSKDLQLCSH